MVLWLEAAHRVMYLPVRAENPKSLQRPESSRRTDDLCFVGETTCDCFDYLANSSAARRLAGVAVQRRLGVIPEGPIVVDADNCPHPSACQNASNFWSTQIHLIEGTNKTFRAGQKRRRIFGFDSSQLQKNVDNSVG